MQLLEIITKMQAGKLDPKEPICTNVNRFNYGHRVQQVAIHRQMDALFKTWPKFSGAPLYPIPVTSLQAGIAPRNQFNMCRAFPPIFWEGEQGELRRELLAHMAKELSNEPT
ncbi:MAG: hypothetical protein HRU18_06630 [Pseudoalteromonas sp.]|uniref:hypothetical protein n=1 Tax=Pseudoalteromonas sp. TaxID=53249 RepID=UPI001E0FE37F|nr:hypothetical protein [Pseudoalteromonas sp.]NRA77865.1 hypothetical protein [Pseudoalteromonas sp.]